MTILEASIVAYLGVNPAAVPTATNEESVDLQNDLTQKLDVGAVEKGLVMLLKTIVKVCAGMIDVDELIFVNYIVLDGGFTVHIGVSTNDVPINCAHADEEIDAKDT